MSGGFDWDRSEGFERGLEVRRKVMGEGHVQRSLDAADADPFLRPIQQAAVEWGWGAIWARPGLDRKTRSMLTVGILTALYRPHELKAHVRGALNNGLTKAEIAEVMLHAAGYAGLPCGLEAFRLAKEVFDEEEKAGRKIPDGGTRG